MDWAGIGGIGGVGEGVAMILGHFRQCSLWVVIWGGGCSSGGRITIPGWDLDQVNLGLG